MEHDDLDLDALVDEDAPDAADQKEKLTRMADWFFTKFEDPVHRCPYNGAEGGYQFIHGQYSAEEQLREHFEGKMPEALISKLADKLSLGDDWSGTGDLR